MTFEEFKPIIMECYPDIREELSVPEAYKFMISMYKRYELDKRDIEDVVFLADGDSETGIVHVRLIWVAPDDRNKGIATEVMKSSPYPLCFVVDDDHPFGDFLLKHDCEVSKEVTFLGEKEILEDGELCYTIYPKENNNDRQDIYN